jgi:glycosyltransferase involved in cell wall biosynthesis
MRYRPHLVGPAKETVHALIVYKDFGSFAGISHIGLGVAAMNNARILNANGFWTEVIPLKTPVDLAAILAAKRAHNLTHSEVPVSHCVISAAWFPAMQLAALSRQFHEIDFTVVSHSNVGFLQADPSAFTILRGTGDLQTGATNIHLGANNQKLIDFWGITYQQPMRLLPNMYDLTGAPAIPQKWRGGSRLRIGCFGAVRPLKNLVTAGAAALEIGARLQADLEFYVSSGRVEGGADTVMRTLQNMYVGLPNATLMQIGWQDWPAFRRQVRNMDLLLQPSYTESFNMSTADGIAEGVPSVTSDAIDWVPSRWIASGDDATDIADVGIALLHDPSAAAAGLAALKQHNAEGLTAWSAMLLEEV